MTDAKLLTTAQDLPGYRVMRSLGVVRRIILLSRSLVGNIGASLKTVFGGSITIYTKLYEKARYDATEIADGVPRSVGLRHGRLRRAISRLKNAKQAGLGTNKEQNQTIPAAGQWLLRSRGSADLAPSQPFDATLLAIALQLFSAMT